MNCPVLGAGTHILESILKNSNSRIRPIFKYLQTPKKFAQKFEFFGQFQIKIQNISLCGSFLIFWKVIRNLNGHRTFHNGSIGTIRPGQIRLRGTYPRLCGKVAKR
eukprot:c19726_g2_i2.p1 GENE.c19726_g2_i2~~c19726_g2_i2.p1  ORF type:complete len:106 (+),score=11.94 c19726_g2_i2:670-987(+)